VFADSASFLLLLHITLSALHYHVLSNSLELLLITTASQSTHVMSSCNLTARQVALTLTIALPLNNDLDLDLNLGLGIELNRSS
jgi:hypothetical protein